MNLQSALECITKSNSINKLNANIYLMRDIESDKIYWSKFDNLEIDSTIDSHQYYINKLLDFNGNLTLHSVKIDSLRGSLKKLDITSNNNPGYNQAEVFFEDGTSIKDMTFRTNLLNNKGYNPSIESATILEAENFIEGDTFQNKEGFLSKTKNISCNGNVNIPYFMSLGYLTVDNETNTNWAKVDVNKSADIQDKSLLIPIDFYNNLIYYVADSQLNHLKLDYINDFAPADEENETSDIVIPTTVISDFIPEEYLPSFNGTELPVILGDYCFGGIGSKTDSDKDRHLYLHFGIESFANKKTETTTNDEDATVDTTKLTSLPFSEKSFISRPGAIQQIHINLPERRENDIDPEALYFSDFFTTVEKVTAVDAEGTENITYNFIIDEDAFTSYKNQLLAMVDGATENLKFGSQYEDIEAYIDVDA